MIGLACMSTQPPAAFPLKETDELMSWQASGLGGRPGLGRREGQRLGRPAGKGGGSEERRRVTIDFVTDGVLGRGPMGEEHADKSGKSGRGGEGQLRGHVILEGDFPPDLCSHCSV